MNDVGRGGTGGTFPIGSWTRKNPERRHPVRPPTRRGWRHRVRTNREVQPNRTDSSLFV